MSMSVKKGLHLKGVIPAVITPFDEAGKLDLKGLQIKKSTASWSTAVLEKQPVFHVKNAFK